MKLPINKLTRSLALCGVFAVAAAAGPAFAQVVYDYEAWDTDSDGLVDLYEFEDAVGEAGFYDRYDADNDGFIDSSEYDLMIADTDTDFDDDDFFDWDLDNDSYLTEPEFNQGLYGAYDRDYDDYLTYDEYEYGEEWFDWF